MIKSYGELRPVVRARNAEATKAVATPSADVVWSGDGARMFGESLAVMAARPEPDNGLRRSYAPIAARLICSSKFVRIGADCSSGQRCMRSKS